MRSTVLAGIASLALSIQAIGFPAGAVGDSLAGVGPDDPHGGPPVEQGKGPSTRDRPTSASWAPTERLDLCDDIPASPFTDVAGSAHRANIDCMYAMGVTVGVTATDYVPRGRVTRAQMATFIANGLLRTESGITLPTDPAAVFTDVSGVHADNIHALAEVGIVQGRSPTRYEPNAHMTRAQMASIMAQTYAMATGETTTPSHDWFDDIDDNVHEDNIRVIRDLEIALGVTANEYRPGEHVRRDQMATFLTNLLVRTGQAAPDPVTRAYLAQGGEELLFVLQREGTGSAYYYGEESEHEMDVTHIVLEDGEGFVGKVIFSEEGYPIHWMFDDQTFAVLATSQRDPENAVHVMVCDDGLEDIELDLDELLSNTIEAMLDAVIAEFGGEQFAEAVNDVRSAVDDLGWTGRTTRQVLDVARTPSEQATSRSLAMAGVAVGMAQRFGAAAVPNVLGIVSQSLDYITRIEEGYYDGSHIEGPTVSMLLCRGASHIPGVCHRFYVHNIPGSATKCGSACQVTLRCFTDICHPYEMSVDRALAYRG